MRPVSPAGGGMKGGGWKKDFIEMGMTSPYHHTRPFAPPSKGGQHDA